MGGAVEGGAGEGGAVEEASNTLGEEQWRFGQQIQTPPGLCAWPGASL